MKAYLTQLLSNAPPQRAAHLLREYLQARILSELQRAGAFTALAFHGGTALRFLYQIPRFSEDLDFALENDDSDFDLRAILSRIKQSFTVENYHIETRLKDSGAVHAAQIRFTGLLYEFDLSPHRDQKLMIRVEVDINPPAGASLDTTIIRRHVMLHLQHHDRASLLAGKLHALLQREYTKGRDIYDLFWYLSNHDWPEPNLAMLNNALAQSGWNRKDVSVLTGENWRGVVSHKLSSLDWDRVINDVRPFILDQADIDLLTLPNLQGVLLGQ